MNWRVVLVFLALVVAPSLSSEEGSSGTADTKGRFTESLRLARANLKTPEGKRCDAMLASYTSQCEGECQNEGQQNQDPRT
jgi:hypothetical protein